MKVLMFLFFLFAALWFAGLILRATFSRWLRKRAEEFNRNADRVRREARRKARSGREGEVTIEGTRASGVGKVNRNVGEYVEFEEITITEEYKGTEK